MKIYKIIMTSILSLGLCYTLYATIGYLILSVKRPLIVGETTAKFTGMYLMSFTFAIISVVILALIICTLRLKSKKNKN